MDELVRRALIDAGHDPNKILRTTHQGAGREGAPEGSAAWARSAIMGASHAFAPIALQDGTMVAHVAVVKSSLIDAINEISPPGKRGEIIDDGERFDVQMRDGGEYGVSRPIAFVGYAEASEIPDLEGLTGGAPLPERTRKNKNKNK